MTEYFYLDRDGRLLGSVNAFTFRDAHAWLAMQNIRYDTVTKFRPRKRKARDRRLALA
jgi:predicted alpha-1,6-mannanase (GH76 family)